jgi:hypothetical protein
MFTEFDDPRIVRRVWQYVAGTSELFIDKELVQKYVDETNHYSQQFKNSRRNIFFK